MVSVRSTRYTISNMQSLEISLSRFGFMVDVVIVCGSGDPNGISYAVCRELTACFSGHGLTSTVFHPYGMDIRHCTGCEACSDGPCVHDDDMVTVLDSLSEATLLVLVSPIHFSGPSSIMKTLMDRFQPFWHNRMPHPRFMAGVLCGGSPEPCFRNTESIMRAFSITVGMDVLGFLEIGDTDRRSENDCISDVPDMVDSIVRGMQA